MKTNLEGQVALVTGAGRNLGAAIARMLAANGARVVCADVDPETARSTAAGLPGAVSARLDVTDLAQAEACVAGIDREWGRLDILVNNAGTSSPARVNIDQFPPEEWERVLRVCLTGAFLVSRAALPLMLRRKYGRIVNISSVLGVVPARLQCAYTAAKAGLVNLSRTMAIELAPEGILVNCVAPGSLKNNYKEGSPLMPLGARLLSHVPLGRPGDFDDVANAVLYLAAPETGYVTGQTLCVDGGWTAGGFFRDF